MERFNKEEIDLSKEFTELKNSFAKQYIVPEYVLKDLIENREIENFCIQIKMFTTISDLCLDYEISHWLVEESVNVVIDSIGVYEDFGEFQEERSKQKLIQ